MQILKGTRAETNALNAMETDVSLNQIVVGLTSFAVTFARNVKNIAKSKYARLAKELERCMKPDLRPPIKSTWRDPIGKPITDRVILNRAKQGFYGEIERLRALARCSDKGKRNAAKKRLIELEGAMPRKPRGRKTTIPVNINEFI